MEPVASIVITAYNAERFIAASVQAALAQSYQDIEVVVLDDGSSDSTERICRSVQDPRFRYIRRSRIGRCRALNEAISAARGQYIAINDADDLSFPHRLQYSMEFARAHSDLAYLGTGFAATEVFYDRIPATLKPDAADMRDGDVLWPDRATLYRRNCFTNSTLFYPKSTWQRIGGYDETLTNSEDYDFHLRALQCGRAALLPGRTVLWYTNPNGFFKQKSRHEYLRAVRVIRRRAHRLLNLPWWLRLYHPAWLLGYQLAQHYPAIIDVVNGARKVVFKGPVAKSALRDP
jgi:glycosyltransferase involved in cell wall biosynthesis